jgi:hypothetical protein
MKLYEKRYEDFIQKKENRKNKFRIKLFDISGDGIVSMEQYVSTIRTEILEMQKEIFNRLVKLVWLFRKFTYGPDHKRMRSHKKNGFAMNAAFSMFMIDYTGLLASSATGRYGFVIDYFDDFFPNFDLGNPFEESYEYPYKYMTFECLMVVGNLPGRMEFLKIGEDQKMNFPKFYDYMINHILCYNEEIGKEYYIIGQRLDVPRININKLYEKRKSKREKDRERKAYGREYSRQHRTQLAEYSKEYNRRRKSEKGAIKTSNVF